MRRWYVVNTKPRAEQQADHHLRSQGFTTWFPRFKKLRRHARKEELVLAPLFPGYLFVELDLDKDSWSAINGTIGVIRILSQQNSPVHIDQEFIHALRENTDEQGCVTLPEKGLEPGQKLRITSGPYQEYIGTLLDLPSRDRVTILLHAFGRDVTATVPKDFILPA